MPDSQEIRDVVTRVVDGVLKNGDPGDVSGQRSSSADPHGGSDRGPDSGSPGSIAIGADHGGFRMKEFLVFRLREAGFDVKDLGTHSAESVDYPDFAHDVAKQVSAGNSEVGIIIDGAGIGSSMVANKVPGIRAALAYDVSSAANSREHNHANVITLGAGLIGDGLAWQIVEAWLATPWAGGRHERRVDMIMDIERHYRGPA